MAVHDGRVWCEACRRWLDCVADYRNHRVICPDKARMVENR